MANSGPGGSSVLGPNQHWLRAFSSPLVGTQASQRWSAKWNPVLSPFLPTPFSSFLPIQVCPTNSYQGLCTRSRAGLGKYRHTELGLTPWVLKGHVMDSGGPIRAGAAFRIPPTECSRQLPSGGLRCADSVGHAGIAPRARVVVWGASAPLALTGLPVISTSKFLSFVCCALG